MKVNGLVTAAGLSSRMGETGFKPLLSLRGKTVIENTVDSMLQAGVEQVVVVLGHRAEEIEQVLFQTQAFHDGKILTAYNSNAAGTDMLCSIKLGLEIMPECGAFFLLPGDMPLIARETFLKLIQVKEETEAKLIFPTIDGHRKHPPLIDSSVTKVICDYQGEDGLRGIWNNFEAIDAESMSAVHVAIEDMGCVMDMDTGEDYKKMKKVSYPDRDSCI